MLTLLTIVCTVGGYAQETVTDELTATTLNVSTKSYQKFATKTLSSGASYDGAAFIDSNNPKGIQIKAKKDTKGFYTGIITSASSGTIKSITINFNSANSNTLGIYGKNTAYTTADDLFGSAAGELIKNVDNSKTAVTITPDKAYKFIGFKSNKGTIYIDKITIVWEKAATTPATTTTFGANSGKTFTFTNGKLEGFTAPKATATKSDDDADLSDFIEYTSSDANIVAVDSKTGELTFTNTKFGKATITATLPKTDTYKTSTDSYFVENKDNHIVTSLSFNGTDITLTEGKTDAGADLTGYTATEANNIDGTITYAASGDAVATVNPTTGAVTINPTVYGTTTITATFTPADPTQYSGSTATYQITNKKAVDLSEIVFNVSEDKVSGTSNLTLTKSIVQIQTSSGALGKYNDGYRFYANSKTTFSLTEPTRVITSIKFVGGSTYDNFTTNKPSYDKTTGTWTGYEKSVVFTASVKVEDVTQIIVTTAEKKPATAIAFEGSDGTTVELTDGKTADGKEFVGYTAKEKNNIEGSITYAASGDAVATVDPKTGKVTINAKTYGTTTITATFKPADPTKYSGSTATYKITNQQKIDESTIVFDCSTYNSSLIGSSYADNDNTPRQLKSVAGKDYTFTLTQSIFMDKSIQMKASSGKIVSPTFSSFPSGYKVVVTYAESTPRLYSAELTDAKAEVNTSLKTVSIELPSPTATFTIQSGTNYTQIQKIELSALIAKNYTLDETKTDNVIETYENANVTLQRTLEASHWNSFCVPFALDKDQVTQYFGEGTQLRTYEGRCENNIVYFATVDNIEAGKPYIMKPGNAVVKNPTFEGVSMVATGLDENGNPQAVGDASTVQMKGIYNHVTLVQDKTNIYIGAGNKFYYPADAEACQMNGLRAYFIVPEGTDIKKLRANLDGATTSLGEIFDTEESNTPVYNLQGQCVGNSLSTLKSGIYVQNGKKVVVK